MSAERYSVSRLQSESLDEKGDVQLHVLRIGAEAKHRIAVHVQEALQTVDCAPCVRRGLAQQLRKRQNGQAPFVS